MPQPPPYVFMLIILVTTMRKKALKTKSSQNGAKNTENVSNDILLALPLRIYCLLDLIYVTILHLYSISVMEFLQVRKRKHENVSFILHANKLLNLSRL